jgi:predicted RNase H-like HicB family nuclease
MQYLVVIEHGPASFGAYVPDLPGCIAVGQTREEVTTLIHEAIDFHIEGLKADGHRVPEPSSTGELITVDAQALVRGKAQRQSAWPCKATCPAPSTRPAVATFTNHCRAQR